MKGRVSAPSECHSHSRTPYRIPVRCLTPCFEESEVAYLLD